MYGASDRERTLCDLDASYLTELETSDYCEPGYIPELPRKGQCERGGSLIGLVAHRPYLVGRIKPTVSEEALQL